MTTFISVIILAAGSSHRLKGKNKLLLPFRGKTILETVVAAVLSLACKEAIVVTGDDYYKIEDVLHHYGVKCIYNPEYRPGMSTSLKKGITALASKDTGIMICLGDMPLITPKLLRKLVQTYHRISGAKIVLPVFEK